MDQLTEEQIVLIEFLRLSGADKDMMIGTTLILDEYPKATKELLLWLDKFNPERKVLTTEELTQIIWKTKELLDEATA